MVDYGVDMSMTEIAEDQVIEHGGFTAKSKLIVSTFGYRKTVVLSSR